MQLRVRKSNMNAYNKGWKDAAKGNWDNPYERGTNDWNDYNDGFEDYDVDSVDNFTYEEEEFFDDDDEEYV